ncbi:aminotransferase family protein [Demequina salsinemoris]|uniref:aminotransferase family protein n=1 Tax=Demequina salsinemoris TaxID=577470 RepID=UPI0007809318|nr:aminotransferase class III-fold pyridoxal phosphate-dependent enzyme [Demequina salsinemoris]
MPGPLIHNALGAAPPVVARAEGVWLWDAEGNRYLDGCAGAVVSAIGHSHPHVVEAIAAQAAKATYAHRGAFTSEAAEAVGETLSRMSGFPGVWLVGSGSEATEAAMQFALQYQREVGEPQRTTFLTARAGYHGSTLGALSASGHARRAAVAGLALDMTALPAGDALRDQGDQSETEYAEAMLREARTIIHEHADSLAAVMIEPVGGATLGANTHPAGYLAGLKRLCEETGALFIADEVMTGMGRTGTVLACDAEGVQADLVAMGKGLGSGYTPIAAVLVSSRVLTAIEQGSGAVLGGHTYAGNPLSAATALAVLEVFETEDVIARGRGAAAVLREQLDELATRHGIVTDVRGRGMLLGLELDAGGRRQGATASALYAACAAHGLVVYPTTGGYVDAVIIAPPLMIERGEISVLVVALDAALTDLETSYEAPQRLPD